MSSRSEARRELKLRRRIIVTIFVGAAAVLARCPTVLCEFSPEYMRQGGIEPTDLIDLMTGHGFEAHLITPNGLEPITAETAARIEPITDLLWQKPAT